MKKCRCGIVRLILSLAVAIYSCDQTSEYPAPAPLVKPPIEYVDPLIGTGGAGFAQANAVPGATAPFGMVKVGPDTSGEIGGIGFAHTAGYWHPDTIIQGFSHTHMHGTGVADYGNILFMPTIGMTAEKITEKGYESAYSHDRESLSPGYYAVTLDPSDIRVELTATPRGAHHRYHFPKTDQAVVIIDLGHTLGTGISQGAEIQISPEGREVSGWMINKGDFGPVFPVYFSARFSHPFSEYGTWNQGMFTAQRLNEISEQDLTELGGYLRFDAMNGEPIEAQVGISYISVAQAMLNRESELTGRTFDENHKATRAEWEKALGTIEIQGGTERERTIFYTALYHSMLMPTLFTDVNGRYVGLDKNVHEAGDFLYYTDFSLWDTYHTLHSLLTLVAPDRQRDMIVTLVKMYEQHGNYPRWPLASSEAGTMVGTPADIVIADSLLKGIRDFDLERAYEGMVKSAGPDGPRDGIADCLNYGFCPADKMGGSVSLTLEYAYADYAIAQVARALGKEDDYRSFLDRTLSVRHHWDPDTQFFRARTTQGGFADEGRFNPAGPSQLHMADHYVEGNAWQYLWLVPYDVMMLIEFFGGRETMITKLDEFFELSEQFVPAKLRVGSSEYVFPDAYYWHGNEPDIHAAYMYTLAGRPDKAPKWIRWIMDTKYTDGPDGLNGNDDAGTLSAWYVFSAMGIFPIAGSDLYVIGSPVLGKSVIHLRDGDFTIEARGTSAENRYVRSATLNGKPLREPWFRHAQIAEGGTLVLEMADTPSQWGLVDPARP